MKVLVRRAAFAERARVEMAVRVHNVAVAEHAGDGADDGGRLVDGPNLRHRGKHVVAEVDAAAVLRAVEGLRSVLNGAS